MNQSIHLPLLDQVRIASPCPARWEDMVGDDRVRLCGDCNLNVHDLSAMTRDEAEGVLAKLAEGRVCARFYRRRDGTILTRDCPVGIAAARAKLLRAVSRIAAAVGFAVLAGAAAKASQDKSWGNWGWSIRLSNSDSMQWVRWKAIAAWNAISPPPAGRGGFCGGVVSMPPGKQPPVAGTGGSPFGPHGWEYRE